jgi:hypothetical protein
MSKIYQLLLYIFIVILCAKLSSVTWALTKKNIGRILAPGITMSILLFSFEAERKTCELLEMGVAAVFGPQNSATADHIRCQFHQR